MSRIWILEFALNQQSFWLYDWLVYDQDTCNYMACFFRHSDVRYQGGKT